MDKILVVDDEPDIRKLMKLILEKEGYKVATASNGDEAIRKADSEVPDIIFLDVAMPGKSGFEVCEILKAQSKTELTPVVLFSALGREVDKKLGRDVGANGYLTKPFTSESLVAEAKKQLETMRQEKFSKHLDLDHTQLKGRKILLEFDPVTPYERAVRDFALEAQTHGEVVVVLSSEASIVHRVLQGDEGLEFVPLTPETIFSQIIDAHAEKHLALVCDNLTDLIITMGFYSAYNFTKNALDRLIDPKITARFLLNPNAHSPNEVYSIRNLFSEQVTYGKDGLTKVKMNLA